MADKRGEIEKVATQAIKREGFRSMSFRTLADEVGVKSSSVHYHFPTKDDLAEAVIRSYTQAFRESLQAIDRRESSLIDKIDAFNGLFAEVVAHDDICLCGMMAAEVSSLNDSARAALRGFFATSEAWLESVFETHAAELDSPLSAQELARVFLAGLEGATLIDRVDAGRDRLAAYRALTRALVV